jgi:hypothetical protein
MGINLLKELLNMCNGLNHYRNCKCGFGMDGFLSFDTSYVSSEALQLADRFYKSYSSKLTIPNFLCRCGKRVFFFQDPNGGKVLFESLGHPWEKHFCLGWQYQKRTQNLNIDSAKWSQMGHFFVTPSVEDEGSNIQGIIKQFEVTIRADIQDLVIIRDIYLDAKCFEVNQKNLEGLIVYEDGNYSFEKIHILKIQRSIMKEINSKKILKDQINLKLFD